MPKEISQKTRILILNTLSVACLFAATFWFTVVNIYIGNANEMSSMLCEVTLGTTLLAAIVFAVVAGIQVCFWWSRFFTICNLVLMCVALLMYIQSNLFLWASDITTENMLSFSAHPFLGSFEILFYVLFFVAVFGCGKLRWFLFANEPKLTAVLILASLIGFFPSLSKSSEGFFRDDWKHSDGEVVYGTKHGTMKSLDKYPISTKQNVIIVVIDSYGEDYFEEILQQKDSTERAAFKDFTHFSKLISPVWITANAVPTLLTGNNQLEQAEGIGWESRNSDAYMNQLKGIYNQGDCLFKNLSENGFQNYVADSLRTAFLYPHNPKLVANSDYKEWAGHYHISNVLIDKLIPMGIYRMSPIVFKNCLFHASDKCLWRFYAAYSHDEGSTNSEAEKPAVEETAVEETAGGETAAEKPASVEEPTAEKSTAEKPASDTTDAAFQGMFTPEEKVLEAQYREAHQANRDNDSFFLGLQKEDFQKTDAPVFLFVHLYGVHAYANMPYRREFFIRESRFFDEEMLRFCEMLKEQGCYDNSYIVILGDHGNHAESVACKRNPMLLIKKPGQTGESMVDNDEVVLMWDIAPTILKDLGLPVVNKQSMWNLTPEEKAERQEYWNRLMVDGQ